MKTGSTPKSNHYSQGSQTTPEKNKFLQIKSPESVREGAQLAAPPRSEWRQNRATKAEAEAERAMNFFSEAEKIKYPHILQQAAKGAIIALARKVFYTSSGSESLNLEPLNVAMTAQKSAKIFSTAKDYYKHAAKKDTVPLSLNNNLLQEVLSVQIKNYDLASRANLADQHKARDLLRDIVKVVTYLNPKEEEIKEQLQKATKLITQKIKIEPEKVPQQIAVTPSGLSQAIAEAAAAAQQPAAAAQQPAAAAAPPF